MMMMGTLFWILSLDNQKSIERRNLYLSGVEVRGVVLWLLASLLLLSEGLVIRCVSNVLCLCRIALYA